MVNKLDHQMIVNKLGSHLRIQFLNQKYPTEQNLYPKYNSLWKEKTHKLQTFGRIVFFYYFIKTDKILILINLPFLLSWGKMKRKYQHPLLPKC